MTKMLRKDVLLKNTIKNVGKQFLEKYVSVTSELEKFAV